MIANASQPQVRPRHYVCPSCHLYLLSWDPPMRRVEMFHKIGLWADFWTGQVRMICQYCLGTTDTLPHDLVDLLGRQFGLSVPVAEPYRRPGSRQAQA
jgi:hypothetical protein